MKRDAFDTSATPDLGWTLREKDHEIFSALSSLVVLHSSFKNAYDTILKSISFNRYTRAPEPNSILVLGESGVGKTTLHQNLLAVLPKRDVELQGVDMITKIPFFHSSLPVTATPTSMAHELLASMGLKDTNKNASTQRVRQALDRAGTQGILYDELHNLAGNQTPTRIKNARAWIRDLITSTGIMVIGFGTPDCQEIFLSEAQVAKRFPVILRLRNFAFEAEGSEFELTLDAFQGAISPFAREFNSFQPQAGLAFTAATYVTTGGNLHAMKQLFETALFNCLLGDRNWNFDLFARTAGEKNFSNALHPNGYRLPYEACINLIANQSASPASKTSSKAKKGAK